MGRGALMNGGENDSLPIAPYILPYREAEEDEEGDEDAEVV